jgi:hypothetical protein
MNRFSFVITKNLHFFCGVVWGCPESLERRGKEELIVSDS